MKKIFQVFIAIILFTFTACSADTNADSESIVVKCGDVPITTPSKSETRYTLVESEESGYEPVATLTQDDLFDLIPAEYRDFDFAEILSFDNGIAYITTKKGSGYESKAKDVFAYDVESGEITYITDISRLDFSINYVYGVNGNYYFFPSYGQIAVYCDGELTLFDEDYDSNYIKTPNGIAASQLSTWSIVEFNGTRKKYITPELYPAILRAYNPIRYVSLTNGHYFLCTIEDNKMTSILDLINFQVARFPNFFWLFQGKGSKTMSMYNYNNEEMLSFEGPSCYVLTCNNKNTMICLDFDGNIWIYRCDEESKTVTKSMLEGEKRELYHFFADDNYIIRSYFDSEIRNDNYIYEIYREK